VRLLSFLIECERETLTAPQRGGNGFSSSEWVRSTRLQHEEDSTVRLLSFLIEDERETLAAPHLESTIDATFLVGVGNER
jgi:hypothetical protein